MKLKSLFLTIALPVTLSGAFANSNLPAPANVEEVQQELSLDSDDVFLGCVSSRRECALEANHHGYHHSMTMYDQHTCHDHHQPLACFGVE